MGIKVCLFGIFLIVSIVLRSSIQDGPPVFCPTCSGTDCDKAEVPLQECLPLTDTKKTQCAKAVLTDPNGDLVEVQQCVYFGPDDDKNSVCNNLKYGDKKVDKCDLSEPSDTDKPKTTTVPSTTSKPTTVTQKPTTVTSKPTNVTSKPSTSTSKPTTITTKSTTSKITTKISKPTSKITPKPSSATPKPTSKPTTAISKLTTVTSMPSRSSSPSSSTPSRSTTYWPQPSSSSIVPWRTTIPSPNPSPDKPSKKKSLLLVLVNQEYDAVAKKNSSSVLYLQRNVEEN